MNNKIIAIDAGVIKDEAIAMVRDDWQELATLGESLRNDMDVVSAALLVSEKAIAHAGDSAVEILLTHTRTVTLMFDTHKLAVALVKFEKWCKKNKIEGDTQNFLRQNRFINLLKNVDKLHEQLIEPIPQVVETDEAIEIKPSVEELPNEEIIEGSTRFLENRLDELEIAKTMPPISIASLFFEKFYMLRSEEAPVLSKEAIAEYNEETQSNAEKLAAEFMIKYSDPSSRVSVEMFNALLFGAPKEMRPSIIRGAVPFIEIGLFVEVADNVIGLKPFDGVAVQVAKDVISALQEKHALDIDNQ